MSVDGTKRDVCVDAPFFLLPAARFRADVWHRAAIGAHPLGATSYYFNSAPTIQALGSTPRAYARTAHLSPGSPAIPPQFKASVLVSMARHEPVELFERRNATHETDADQRHAG